MRRDEAAQGGFTLIEVMISVAILAMVAALTFSSFHDTLTAKYVVEDNAERYHSIRLAMQRMSRELEMAYLSQNEDTSQPERRTFFIGKRQSTVDELRFSYMGHQRLYADSKECDTAQVAYFGDRDPNDSSRTDLMRRETRRLGNVKMSDAAGSTDVLCDDIVSLHFDYWDARDKDWREEWMTTSADGQPDRLPGKVRITLTVLDERGKEVPFVTEVRLPMQEPLNLRPR